MKKYGTVQMASKDCRLRPRATHPIEVHLPIFRGLSGFLPFLEARLQRVY